MVRWKAQFGWWGRAIALAATLVAPWGAAMGQGSPFNCDVVFYQVRNASGSVLLRFPSVSATVTPTSVYTATQTVLLNSVGYNPVDNYMYGIQAATGIPQLYRIGSTGYQLVGAIGNVAGSTALTGTFLPTGGWFDAAGRYYFAGQGGGNISPAAIFRVDFIPGTGAVTVAQQYNLTAPLVNVGDFDFNGAGGPNGLLLAATGTTFARVTLAENLTTPAAGTATVATAVLPSSVGGIGSAFFDAFTGRFYVFDNGASTFSEVTNPLGTLGTQGVSPVAVPFYSGPPALNGTVGSTDGTSCPISGTRIADVSVQKSDGLTSLPTGSVASYQVTVTNAGPYPANYMTIQDTPSAGLQLLSVTCSAPGGPPSAVCPAGLSTTSFAAGIQVLIFPPGTRLVFTVNALVTASAGATVTNTVQVTPSVDFTDPTSTNNISRDVNSVTAPTTQVVSGAQLCPVGTTEQLTNLVSGGDFAGISAANTQATNVGALNTLAARNSVQPQTGFQQYLGPPGGIAQNPFPGDSARSVGGSNNWLLANGKTTGSPNYAVWFQPITGLTVGRTYQLMFYASNATRPGSTSPTVPDLRLQVNQGAGTTTLASASATWNATESNNETVTDTWTLVQGTFTASATAVTVSIADFAAASATNNGNAFALAQATLRACVAATDVSVVKTATPTTFVSLSTATYTLVVANLGSVTATNVVLTDPPVANVAKNSVSFVTSAGSTGPTGTLTVLALEGSGINIPLIAPGGRVTATVRITATGNPGTTATNVATIASNDYLDSNPSNNVSQVSNPLIGQALLSITKTNVVTVLQAGQTTSYTITIQNSGPSTVSGAIFRDPVAAGLTCTSVSCLGVVGATSCPAGASVTIANLQGSGIVLPTMIPPSSVQFAVNCNVTATGRP